MTIQRTGSRILCAVVAILICFGRYEWIVDVPLRGASYWNPAEARDRDSAGQQGSKSGVSNPGAQTQTLSEARQSAKKGKVEKVKVHGKFSGTFSGDNVGRWSGKISKKGEFKGKGKFRGAGKFKATGTVTPTGEFTATTNNGAFMNGSLDSKGRISGGWVNQNAIGTFKGNWQKPNIRLDDID